MVLEKMVDVEVEVETKIVLVDLEHQVRDLLVAVTHRAMAVRAVAVVRQLE